MGEIITFYSFKGGTGRSMALANTAVLLSRKTEGRVLMMDWDMEAPGLEDYFRPHLLEDINNQSGILEWVESANKKLPKIPYKQGNESTTAKLIKYFEKINDLIIPVKLHDNSTNLFLLRSGNRENEYARRVTGFDWAKFYQKIPEFFPEFSRWLSVHFDYVLIDSRTGHSDTGGICTVSMPDKLVLVFTPNEQSLSGVIQTAHSAANYRINYDGSRPLGIFPLPSRIDFSGVADAKRETWQNDYRLRWEKAFREIYELPATINLKSYFENIYIRHDSNYAFGEELAVLSLGNNHDSSIQKDYERLVTHLAFEEIWENQPFANMAKPFEVFFAFSEQDNLAVRKCTNYLGSLKRDKVINWNEPLMIPVEHWKTDIQQKAGEGRADVILVFASSSFANQPDNVKLILDGKQNTSVFKILLSPTDNMDEIESLSRQKPISDWPNQEEAWTDVAKTLRYKLAKLHQKKLTQTT